MAKSEPLPLFLIDTREPDPAPWENYFSLPTVRTCLPTGDYSLDGFQSWVSIERKTLDDLIGCLTVSRERFTRELERAASILHFYVVVEARYSDLLQGNYRSQMNPRSAWESVVALQHRYAIPFLFAGSQEVAATLCESILLRFWRDHQSRLEARSA